MTPSSLIYADLFNGRACSSPNGTAFTFPRWVAGGSQRYAVRFLDYIGSFYEKDYAIARLRVALGGSDTRPTSGTFRLKIGSGTTSGANTTPPLEWNASASAVEAALNALTARPSDFSCIAVPGGVAIERLNGGSVALTVRENKLWPRSLAHITESVAPGGALRYELRPTVAPLAFSDSAARQLPSAPTISTVQEGGSDGSGTFFWNEIQALVVPPDFRGTYQLRFNSGKTALLDVTSSTEEMETALNQLLAATVSYTDKGEVRGSCKVTNPTQNTAHIEFTGALAGSDVEPLEIAVFSAPPGDWTFDLPLNRAELMDALRKTETLSLPFEAEADFYVDANNHLAGTVTRKLWNTTVTVVRPAIWPDMAEVPNVDWLHPSPKDYAPFSPDQVLTGQQHFVTAVGDGDAASFTITHGLDTDALSAILVRENTSGGRVLRPDEYTVTVDSADAVTLLFDVAPDSVVVVITASGPASVFAAHKHALAEIGSTVDDVFQPVLLNTLDDLGTRLAAVEALMGRRDAVVVSSGNKQSSFSLPVVGEILPDASADSGADSTVASQIAASRDASKQTTIGGTELETQRAAAAAEAARLKAEEEARAKAAADANKKAADEAAKTIVEKPSTIVTRIGFPGFPVTTWPAMHNGKFGKMLPALHPASVTPTATLPTAPPDGAVWQATAAFILPGGGGRKSQALVSGNLFGYANRAFYRVSHLAGTQSFYPLEMERELARAVIRPEQFPASSKLTLPLELSAWLGPDGADAAARSLERVVTGAQYLFRLEAAPITDVATVGEYTAGGNIGAEGSALVLFQTPLSLSPATEIHSFRLELSRPASGPGTGAVTRYGVQSATPPLPAGPFVLRARLAYFDTDDTTTTARGQVIASLAPTQLVVELTR